jgi:hypothetical protein
MSKIQNNYAAWGVREDNFPAESSLSDKIRFLLEYGVLAPSTHNTQPWQFSVNQDVLVVSIESDRLLPASDPNNNLAYFSLGTCLMNIFVAANHFGFNASYSIIQNNNKHAVQVKFQVGGNTSLKWLFSGILTRRSHKTAFSVREVPEDLLKEVNKIRYGSATILATTSQKTIDKLASIHRDSTLEFSTNKKFTSEVGKWMRTSGTKKYDGMPGFTFGLTGIQPLLAKIMTRLTPKSVSRVATSDFRAIKTAAMVGNVFAENISFPEGLIEAGMAYEHLGLLLAQNDFYLAPKAAIIQSGRSAELSELLGIKGQPLLYFAAGYVKQLIPHSPRLTADMTLKGRQ